MENEKIVFDFFRDKNVSKVIIERCYSKLKYSSSNVYEQIVNKEPIPYENIKVTEFEV